MRICLISGAHPPVNDGIGDYTARLKDAFSENGAEACLITTDEEVIRTYVEAKGQRSVYPVVKRWDFFGIKTLIGFARTKKFDVINIQYPSTGYRRTLLLCLLPLLLRVFCGRARIVTTLHEFSLALPVNKLRQIIMAASSQTVIVTNENDFKSLSAFLPLGKRKIRVVPIGSAIDVHEYDPKAKEEFLRGLDLGPDTIIVTYFGVMHDNKGVECLLDAGSRLMDGEPPIHFLFISKLDNSGNAYHRKIKRLIETLGMENHIFWTNYREPKEVSKFLSMSDICVLPFADGMSLRRSTAVAALLHGRPVISTRARTHVPGELAQMQNIVLVPVGDADMLSKAIAELCRNRALRRRIGEGASLLAKQFYWKRIGRMHIETYKQG